LLLKLRKRVKNRLAWGGVSLGGGGTLATTATSTCICCLFSLSNWYRVKLLPTLKPNLKRSAVISAKNKSLIAGSVKVGGLWICMLWLVAKQAGRPAGRAADPLRPDPCEVANL
jgi:hypothetical protein